MTESITIKSLVSTTLTALLKPSYHHLSCAIFWRNCKNAGFALDSWLVFEVRFQRWTSSHHRIRVHTIKMVVSTTLTALLKPIYHRLSCAIFWRKCKNARFALDSWLVFEVRFQPWTSSHHHIRVHTIKLVVLTTLTALLKPIYHRLSCIIFWRNRKNAGFALDNCLSVWGPFLTLNVFTSLQ